MLDAMVIISFSIFILIAIQLSNGYDFTCEWYPAKWRALGELKNCYGRQISILNPKTIIESVNGDKDSTYDDIEGFWIENEVVNYVPEKVTTFLPNIKAFGIDNCGLKIITKDDLKPFTKLIRFEVHRNELQYLESDLFTYNKELKFVTVFDNNLMVVGDAILKPLPELTQTQFEIRCLQRLCISRSCVVGMQKQIHDHCQSEQVIIDFKKRIQELEDNCLNNV
ncbi:CLUMA_CG005050, isoform A [Clunio marinus]|uniref:CLUMA_CG005050, isoform A n=1 Tax=Clunio marinus TaxID=568069 RepID=A0A1J1HZ33_9DIPT|nr:CLUMA_CG005050, isoform A [Clunio marinus]